MSETEIHIKGRNAIVIAVLIGVLLGFGLFYTLTFIAFPILMPGIPTGEQVPNVTINQPDMPEYPDQWNEIASIMPNELKLQLEGIEYQDPLSVNVSYLTEFNYPEWDEGKPSIIMLYTPSCGYCHKIFEELSIVKTELGDGISIYPVRIKLFDQDEEVPEFNMHVAEVYGFTNEQHWGTPTFVINGNQRHIGFVNATVLKQMLSVVD